MKNILNEENCCEVLNLSQISKKCPQVIKKCSICEGIVIDNDNVPEEYIVDYNDRQIYSALHKCAKCGAIICENCSITIEDAWEQIYVCSDCAEKYAKKIDKIKKLQKKVEILTEEIYDRLEVFLNDKNKNS